MDVAASARTCSREVVGSLVDLAVEKSSCTYFVDSGAGLAQVAAV